MPGYMLAPHHIKTVGAGGDDELIEIIKIIRSNDTDGMSARLDILYKYNPDTIALDKYQQKKQCENFTDGVCDCFYPDVEFDDCYCSRKRKEYLKRTDYRNTKEYQNWRISVFKRDLYTCQDCDQVGGEINAHHIKTFKKYPDSRYDVDNGVTLCVNCHRLRHGKKK